ncbi:MAG: ABC transporter ATP-binding protein [Nitrospirae bacterium]|nr:ABC transporter ATP-binding protein [Nitrospirota bacterium]
MTGEYAFEDTVKGRTDYAGLLRGLAPFVRAYPRLFLGGMALVVLGMGLSASVPYLLARAIDEGILPGRPRVVLLFGVCMLVFEGVRTVVQAGYRYLLQALGQHVMYDLRLRLFGHVQELPAAYFDRNPAGRVVTRLSNDVNAMADLFSSGLVVIVGDLCVIAGILVFMAILNAELALVFCAALPLMAGAAIAFSRRMKGIYREVRRKLAAINGFLAERLHPTAVATLKLYGTEEKTARRFDRITDDYYDELMKSTRMFGLFHPVVAVLSALGISLVLFYGGAMHLRGDLTFGVLVAFLTYSQNVAVPIRDIVEKYNLLQSSMSSAERVWTVLSEPTEDAAAPERAAAVPAAGIPSPRRGPARRSAGPPRRNGGEGEGEEFRAQAPAPSERHAPALLQFDHVSFSYDGRREVLTDVSFALMPGLRNALVGTTGSGKTTVAHLAVRFYEPRAGRILLNGADVREMDRRELRRRVGLVSQDPFLFSGPLEASLGGDGNGGEGYWEALERAGLGELLEKIRRPIRSGGLNLSMGERQVVSLLRLLRHDPEIVVLDEATSYVDALLEAALRKLLAEVLRGRTSLVIAHRVSTIADSDHVWLMSQGRLVGHLTADEFARRVGRLC